MLTAPVPAGPIGAPIDTIAFQGGQFGVSVGGAFYAIPSKAQDGGTPVLQMLVLDRGSLAKNSNTSFSNSQAGANALLQALQALSAACPAEPTATQCALVVITKPDATSGSLGAAAPTVANALTGIGVSLGDATIPSGTSACGQTTGLCSAFSAIGVPGLPSGQGDFNPGLAGVPGSGMRGGDLHGYLQTNATGATFSFIDRERVPFDTGAPSSNPAKVSVGGASYTSAKLSSPGFFVVVLDAGTLAPLAQGTWVEGADADPGSGRLIGMNGELFRYVSDPSALVIVRSIGNVGDRSWSGDGLQWDAVASELRLLGGSRFYFEALNPANSGVYAQVGPGGQTGSRGSAPAYPSPWTQVASTEHSDTGELSGLLARNPSSQFYPDESAAPNTPLDGTLAGLISQPASPWPYRDSNPGHQAALQCIANKLGLSVPIEAAYASNTDVDWGDKLTVLENYPGTDCPQATDFAAIQSQLESEFQAVNDVDLMIKSFKSQYNSPDAGGADLYSIASGVNQDAVQPAQNDTVSAAIESVLSDSLWLLSAFPISDTASGLLNFFSAASGLAIDLITGPNGARVDAPVTVDASDLASRLETQYEDGVNGLNRAGDILVSDWHKLRIAAANSQVINGKIIPPAVADWSFNSDISAQLDDALRLAARREAYEQLFPLKYQLYQAQAGSASNSVSMSDVTTYRCRIVPTGGIPNDVTFSPFRGTPRFGGTALSVAGPWPLTPSQSADSEFEQWVFATPDDRFINVPLAPDPNQYSAHYPTQSLLNEMFFNPQNDIDFSSPPFNTLQFSLESYNDGQQAETVTHTSKEIANNGTPPNTLYCVTAGPPRPTSQ